MWEDLQARIFRAATRARTAMTYGATLDQVLCDFMVREKFDSLDSEAALCHIAARPMDRHCAEVIDRTASGGRSYAHLTLADLELLGDTPDGGDVDSFTLWHRHDAIIERKPYLLHARDPRWSKRVALYATEIPLRAPSAQPTGWISGEPVTFEGICDNVRRSAAAWPSEFCLLRDEPDLLLLHFLRAPSASAPV